MEQIMTTGKIGIELEMKNITPAEIQKLKDYFIELINLQVHRFKNGRIIMHFDNKGDLQKIEVQQTAWKRKKLDKHVGIRL